MNFIDKLNILIGNEQKTTTAAADPCWNGFGDPTPNFPGTIVSRSGTSVTYRFPLNDPCITVIVNEVNGRRPKMCGSGVGLPCCLRRNPSLTKCMQINTTFRIPYEGSGLSPAELDPNHLQVPPGSPILVVGTINVYPTGYEFTTNGAKPHLADMDALPLDQQTYYIDRQRQD